jgi:hypothetical protein
MASLVGDARTGNRFMSVLGVAMAGIVMMALLSAPAAAKMTLKDKVGDNELKLQIYGFSQLEMRGGDGWEIAKGRENSGLDFQAQRIRVGFNYFHGPVAGKLFLDFNQSHSNNAAGLPMMIKDAFVAYKFNDSAFLRLGMIKTPLGMSFTVPGWNLDNIERSGLDKGLVLERDFGLMLSGRLIGQENYAGKKQMKTNGLEMGTERQGYGFGYDLGIFNPAGRSKAVANWDDVRGDALAYAARIHYDYGPELHLEAAYAVSEQAGGVDTEDYEVWDFGVASEWNDWEFKFEYINGDNIQGEDGREQSCAVLTVGYLFHPAWQVVVKTYQAEHERVGYEDTDLGNTYFGFNIFPARVSDKHRDLQRHKIVVNYVFTNGDDEGSTNVWDGIGGYIDDTFGVQWQYKF